MNYKRVAYFIVAIHMMLYYGWLFLFDDSKQLLLLGANMFQLLAPFISFLFLLYAYQRTKTKYWIFFALGALAYFLGQVTWNIYELILGQLTPFPGIPDIFYLSSLLLFFWALVALMKDSNSSGETPLQLIDIFLFMLLMSLLVWVFFIHPILQLKMNVLSTVVAVAYPIGDLGLLFGVLLLFIRRTQILVNKGYLLLQFGFFLQVISHFIYLYLSLNEKYATGSLIDPLFSLSIFFIGLAGLEYQNAPKPRGTNYRSKKRWMSFVFHYMAFFILILIIVVNKILIDGLEIYVLALLFANLLVIVRLFFSQKQVRDVLDLHRKTQINVSEELALAKSIQESALTPPIQNEHIQMSIYYKPSAELSGDMYSCYQIDEHRYGVMILDVMGHGISSALIGMSLRTLFQGMITKGLPADIVLKELNKHLYRMFENRNDMKFYCTGIYLIIDVKQKTIKFANAGHPSGIWLASDGNLLELSSSSPPIGMLEFLPVESETIPFETEGRLLIYSDGLLDRISSQMNDGKEILKLLLENSTKLELDILKEKVINLQMTKYHTTEDEDDECFIIVDVKGPLA